MLCREIIAVCSEIHIKHTNTLCGQNVEFVNVKHGGTYSKHCVLKSLLGMMLRVTYTGREMRLDNVELRG
jgi:hypothetical protein